MADELDDAQKGKLAEQLAMVTALAELPALSRHDTRFANEVALKAPASAMDDVRKLVVARVGPPLDDGADPGMLEALGGIRGNQSLHSKDLGGGLTLYVAFWPWGGGSNVTIKIGVYQGS